MQPYNCWSLELVVAIASEFPWSHAEILQLPALAAFHYAMIAKRVRWERIEDQILATSWTKLDKRSRAGFDQRLRHMLSGPGRKIRWEDQLSDREREETSRLSQVTDDLYARFKEAGVLRNPDGSLPMESYLGKPKRKKS